MEVANFSRLRINGSENFVDVSSNGRHHISDFVELTAYDFDSFVEIRRKDNKTVMLVFKYNELEPSDYWKDADIIYSNRKEKESML